MANCIMCGKPTDNYPGYVTDGVITVCNDCASSNSLMRIVTRIENSGLSANLKSVFSPLIEGSLVNQTDEHVELDKDKLDAKRELESDIENMSQDDFYSKYADNPAALDMWHDYHGEPSEFPEV